MTFSAGYLVDLQSVKFNDSSNESWIQAMPLGKYTHPIYGVIELTAERIARFADNVNKKVRGQDLDIDYDHKAKTDEAAGWVVKADARNDGLWLLVSWTEKARQLIKDRAYRYFSPEFTDSWKHPKSGETFTDVLAGGGITNRPFLKDIVPINLSEFFSDEFQKHNPTQGENMTAEQRAQLLVSLGLPETATDADIVAALLTKVEEAEKPEEKSVEEKAAEPAPVAVAASENPQFKLLSEQINAMQIKLDESEKKLHESAIKEKVVSLTEVAKSSGYTIAIPVRDKMTVALSDPTLDNVEKAFASLLAKDSIVQLGESQVRKTSDVPAESSFESGVKALMLSEKLDYSSALLKFAEENPEAYSNYRDNLLEGGN